MKIVLSNQAKFTPYTFDELLKVPAMYTAEYNAIEDQYTDALSKLQAYQKYAEDNPKAEWAQKYNRYVELGKNAVDDMATNRLSAKSRSDLKKYLRDYNAITVPIEEGIKTYKEQEAVRLANPNRLYKKALTFDDVMSGNIDNSFTTEEDIAKETLAAYSPKFYHSYANYIDEGKKPEEAARLAREDHQTIVNDIKKKYNGLFNGYNDIINKAVDLGTNSVEIEAAKNELLTRAQRIANKQAERAYWRQINSEYRNLATRGLEIDPNNPKNIRTSTDPNNVFWKSKGFTLDEKTGEWSKIETAKPENKANRSFIPTDMTITDEGVVPANNSTRTQNAGAPMSISFNSLTGKYDVRVSGESQAFMSIDPTNGTIVTTSGRGVDVEDDDIATTLGYLGTQIYNYARSNVNVIDAMDIYMDGSNVTIKSRNSHITPSNTDNNSDESFNLNL